MWKWLHQLARPERLYHVCGRFVPWLGLAAAACLLLGWAWGFGFAPKDYQQGDSFRIIYIHVPAAMWSMGIYASMAVAAFIGLVWQMKMSDTVVAAMAPIGAVFTFIALVTGSAWGKPMWGTWWVWDARLTSELVLLFLYMGVIALYNAFEDRRLAPRRRDSGAGGRGEYPDHPFFGRMVEYAASGLDQYAAIYRAQHAHPAALGDPRLPAAVRHADADAPAQSDPVPGAPAPVGRRAGE